VIDFRDYVYVRTDPDPIGALPTDRRKLKDLDLAATRAHLKAARDNGFDVDRRNAVTERVSVAVAASGRPKFMQLLRKLGPGTGLVVQTLDGLGRDPADILKTIHRVNASGAEVYCIAVGGEDLPTYRDGMVLLENLAALSSRVTAEQSLAKGLGRGVAGGRMGRPRSLDDAARAVIRAGLDAGETVAGLAREHNTSRQTILRVRDEGR